MSRRWPYLEVQGTTKTDIRKHHDIVWGVTCGHPTQLIKTDFLFSFFGLIQPHTLVVTQMSLMARYLQRISIYRCATTVTNERELTKPKSTFAAPKIFYGIRLYTLTKQISLGNTLFLWCTQAWQKIWEQNVNFGLVSLRELTKPKPRFAASKFFMGNDSMQAQQKNLGAKCWLWFE